MKLGLGLFGSGATFRMASLFAGGEDGIVIDRLNPSSGNLFQDAAGNAAVNAAGQPVGLVISDAHGGLTALGANVSANPGFDSDTDWSKQTGWTISGGAAHVNSSAAGTTMLRTTTPVVSGEMYQIEFTISSVTGAGLRAVANTKTSGVNITSPGTYTLYIVANGASNGAGIYAVGSDTVATVDNVSVRLVPGRHAIQESTALRPLLQQDGLGKWYLADDQVNDALSVTLPDMGTDATEAWADASGITINTGLTIGAGARAIPGSARLFGGYLLIDRALTPAETAAVTAYLEARRSVNLVANGTFDSDTVWTKNTPPWTISGGAAVSDGSASGNLLQSLTAAVVPGNTYRVEFDASATGALKIGVGNNNAALTHHDVTAGANSIDVIGGTAHSELRIRVILTTEDYTGTIDNVVVNDVT